MILVIIAVKLLVAKVNVCLLFFCDIPKQYLIINVYNRFIILLIRNTLCVLGININKLVSAC